MSSWIRERGEELAGLSFTRLVALTVLVQEETITRLLAWRDDPESLREEAGSWHPWIVGWLASNVESIEAKLERRCGEDVFGEMRRVLAAELATRGDDA